MAQISNRPVVTDLLAQLGQILGAPVVVGRIRLDPDQSFDDPKWDPRPGELGYRPPGGGTGDTGGGGTGGTGDTGGTGGTGDTGGTGGTGDTGGTGGESYLDTPWSPSEH